MFSATTMSQRDPRWVGAWWIGFLIFGSAAIIVSVPILLFPASLRKTRHTEAGDKKVEAKEKQQEQENNTNNTTESFKDIVKGKRVE